MRRVLEVIKRRKAARDAGADNSLLEGVKTQIAAQAVKVLAPIFLLLNIFDHEVTPIVNAKEKIMMRCYHRLMKLHEEHWRSWKKGGDQGLQQGIRPAALPYMGIMRGMSAGSPTPSRKWN